MFSSNRSSLFVAAARLRRRTRRHRRPHRNVAGVVPRLRRALLFGIHRESILNTQLLRNRELAGARIVSGPFPTGYAYNNAVDARPYEPRVAVMLASVDEGFAIRT